MQPSLKDGMEVIIPASKEFEKTKQNDICGWDGACSYDSLDCGCDEYEMGR